MKRPTRSPARAHLASWIAGAAAAALALGAPGLARADGPGASESQADRLFEQGREETLRGHHRTACALYLESYRLDPATGTLINLGDCHENLANLEEALDFYRRAFRELKAGDPRVELVAARISSLERRAARLEVRLGEGAAAETHVRVDDRPVERGRTILLQAGAHLVVATAVGFKGSRQSLTLGEGETRRLYVWPGPPLDGAVPAEPSAPPAPTGTSTRTLAWIVGGVGVAGLWSGSILGVLAAERESRRAAHCDAENVCDQEGYDAARSGQTFATASTVSVVAGALLLAGGITLYVTSSGASQVAVSPTGATWRASF